MRVSHGDGKGSTLFLPRSADVLAEAGKGSQRPLLSIAFVGGAASNLTPHDEAAVRAMARAYARAAKAGKFSPYQVVVATGAATAIPDMAMQEFKAHAPNVPRVGYSSFRTVADTVANYGVNRRLPSHN